MPAPVNSNYSANFQRFVDFANNACATSGENTAARFTGMPKGDYKGSFASLLRTADMKSANDQVRDNFLKTIAGMFGGEKFIPDIVRDNMKLEDFSKGKPLTARRIQLVKIAIDTLGGGKFADGTPAAERALQRGYTTAELPKLARAATIYQQATNCTNEEAEAAALDPSSDARRLYDYGGRFTLNAEAFKAGLDLMDKFATWYGNLMDDCAAKNLDTPTKLNLNFSVCTRDAGAAVQKFVFEEIAVNGKIPLNAKNAEDLFGMAKNPAMRFVGRGYTTSFSNSLAQIPPEKRGVIYAVFDALDKLPANAGELAKRDKVGYSLLVAARVMKNFDAVAALQASGKLDRAHLVRILYPDLGVSPGDSNRQISSAYETRVARDPAIMPSLHMLAENSGATLDEADAAISSGTRLENAPGISSFSGKLEEMDGTARGGRKTMIYDLVRPTTPSLTENEKPALADENVKFVFNFPDGETIDTITGSLDEPNVHSRCDAIADKIADLCGNVHPKQLSNVYFALSQSAIGVNVNGGFASAGISSDEHMPVTFTLSRNDETGAVTIKYSEPKGMPVKFNWTTTIDVDGKTTTTQMRIDHGQYEATALEAAASVGAKLPAGTKEAGEAFVREMLAHCGDDFDLKDVVSKNMKGLCVNGANLLRSPDEIKARIDAIRANIEEVRHAARGNARIEKAGIHFLAGLGGKSVPAGLFERILRAARSTNPGDFAKLNARSTPQQILKGLIDLREATEAVIRGAKVRDHLEGGDEMLAARDLAAALVLSRFTDAGLRNANAALRSETTAKLVAVLDDFAAERYPAGTPEVSEEMSDWIQSQSVALGRLAPQYNMTVETMLGKDDGVPGVFRQPFDKRAFGAKALFQTISAESRRALEAQNEEQRRNGVVNAALAGAKARAANAYAKAGEGNAEKVDNIILDALRRCSDNDDAVQVVAANIGTLLVNNGAELRTLQQVRERVDAISANFAELKALAQDNPAVYEAGKRLMAGLGGKALPPGTIGKLVAAAANTPIDAIRKLSSRSSGLAIHRAVTQLRDGLVRTMDASGAEQATGGPEEKQACRNFIAALMMARCGARTVRAMQGAFRGDTASKMLALYMDIGNGRQNDDLTLETAMRFEDQGTSHMTHIGALKAAIDLAATGQPGEGLVPFNGDFNADAIDGPDILDDLVNQAAR
jgi:hypothetical protein